MARNRATGFIRAHPWQQYATTVDAIEQASGYDVLAKLPDHVEWLVEAGVTSPSSASAEQLIGILEGGIGELVARGELPSATGTSFLSKLADARAFLAAGSLTEAASSIRALVREADGLVRGGRLTTAQVASIGIVAGWIVAAIG